MSLSGETLFQLRDLQDTALLSLRARSLTKLEITTLRDAWEESVASPDQMIFFYHAIIHSIEAYMAGEYTKFDAHTTTNCCHGIAVFAREQVLSLSHLDVAVFKQQCLEKIQELECGFSQNCLKWVPECLFNLAALYTLAITRKFVGKKMQTDVALLKDMYPVSTKFCRALASKLKKTLSNIIAYGYKDLLEDICPSTELHEIPIHVWGRYVQPTYIRSDKRNIHYAPCLFSNQISLTHLASSKAKVALVNDIVDSHGNIRGRYVCLFKGDGKSKLVPINESLDRVNPKDPVVVFGGYVHSDTLTVEQLSQNLAPWIHDFQKLMLACDLFYPQFPTVKDDPNFNSVPISPKEQELQELFYAHSQVAGVSARDPSLYCASHIYASSMQQILKTMQEKDLNALPVSFHGIHPSEEQLICNRQDLI